MLKEPFDIYLQRNFVFGWHCLVVPLSKTILAIVIRVYLYGARIEFADIWVKDSGGCQWVVKSYS